MTERRFSEAEVAKIFQRATEAQQAARGQLPPGDGLTLAQLQEIGREVGIPTDLVAQAARSLDRGGRPATRRFLGLTIGVGRTVELGRRLSDAEWEQLVVDLRETFDARGSVRHEGALRQWTNANLQALLEPTPDGHRLRLQTVKGDARAFICGGLGMLGVGAAMLITSAVLGRLGDLGTLSSLVFLSTMGLGMFGIGAARLPGWARLRQRQMEQVATRLSHTAESPPAKALPAEER